MRIIFVSMPLVALVAIFASSANRYLEIEGLTHSVDTALPEALVIMKKSSAKMVQRCANEQVQRVAEYRTRVRELSQIRGSSLSSLE